jgi:hypothetical protein
MRREFTKEFLLNVGDIWEQHEQDCALFTENVWTSDVKISCRCKEIIWHKLVSIDPIKWETERMVKE